jgi:hypothetical protein
MTSKSDILAELEGIAPLLAAQKHAVPFQAPAEYFTLFADGLLDNIHQANHSSEVPAGYFDGFSAQMLQLVRGNTLSDELKVVAPVLNDISKEMPFYLPDGYFENFEVKKVHTTTKEPGKLVSLFGKTLIKWAAAAAVILSIGFTWIYFSKQTSDPVYTASLSMQEMDSLLNQMEEGNLNGLLEEEGTDSEFTILLLAAQEEVGKSVQNLSTEELNGYLENFTLPIEEGI